MISSPEIDEHRAQAAVYACGLDAVIDRSLGGLEVHAVPPRVLIELAEKGFDLPLILARGAPEVFPELRGLVGDARHGGSDQCEAGRNALVQGNARSRRVAGVRRPDSGI